MTSEEGDLTDGAAEAPKKVEYMGVINRDIVQEMKVSYLTYSMSVIVGRALPDARDGLKPVHRRILYAMNEGGMTAGKPYKKSGRIVGDVLGKYHPHGDSAIYDSLVRMAQPFSLRYPLIDGQGNFGSVDGDPAAAMRYTESRTTRLAQEIIEDIERDTVDFVPNYDGSMQEPTVLPSKVPNLLINGSSGIAVGMATNMAPHNLSEIVEGMIALIGDPETDILSLMEHVKGPDFPTGGIIYGNRGIYEAYETGRGKITIRAKADIEGMEGERQRIVVSEIPYQVNKSTMLEKIAELIKARVIEGISDMRDESDKDGLRVVFELRRDAVPEVVLNQLYANTDMQSTFGIINLALVNGQPVVLSLKGLMEVFIDHRRVVTRRKVSHDLKKARERLHIVEGLIIALDRIDEVIAAIRASQDPETARNRLMEEFALTEVQAKAILDMKLQKLTSMESEALRAEGECLRVTIVDFLDILSNPERVSAIIIDELRYLSDKYGDERRTDIEADAEEIDLEDLIKKRDVVILTTNTGYIKRMDLDTYQTQHRGGKGLKGMATKDEDYVVDLFICSSHDHILFFTSGGRVFWMKGYNIPSGSRQSKGKALVNMLPHLEPGETIRSRITVSEFDASLYLVFVTRNGTIKRTSLVSYSRPRSKGIRALLLEEDDELVDTAVCREDDEIVLSTALGMSNRFKVPDVRSMGRSAYGVIGMRMKHEGDRVVSMAIIPGSEGEEAVDEEGSEDGSEESEVYEEGDVSLGPILLTITSKGFGKRAYAYRYRLTRRGSAGVINIPKDYLEETGEVVKTMRDDPGSEILLGSQEGMVIRTSTSCIRLVNRVGKGVKVMRLKEIDRISAASLFREPMGDQLEMVECEVPIEGEDAPEK
ncbi:MAG: DNA gyrase subunit A [Candidatus Thermoplasmatota archaeon]|nr:DNA gyrase subunit A [Candidatus Thermoplasmatota archaeon]